jgi:hypothetical protein
MFHAADEAATVRGHLDVGEAHIAGHAHEVFDYCFFLIPIMYNKAPTPAVTAPLAT